MQLALRGTSDGQSCPHNAHHQAVYPPDMGHIPDNMAANMAGLKEIKTDIARVGRRSAECLSNTVQWTPYLPSLLGIPKATAESEGWDSSCSRSLELSFKSPSSPLGSLQRPQSSEEAFEPEVLFPPRDAEVHPSSLGEETASRKPEAPDSVCGELGRNTAFWTAWGWGADSLLHTATLKIDTCPILTGLTRAIFKAVTVGSAPHSCLRGRGGGVESAPPLPLNPGIKGVVVTCKLGVEVVI